jgi:hypothetical protein
MTLILNGTDNSATTPAVTGTDTDTGVYYPAANQVALATNGTQAVLVNATQGVQFNYGISVGGTAPSTDGTGIKFPATQISASDANTLDDYEEGTWTPALGGSASNPTGVTYGTAVGKYTKVGNLVTVFLYMTFTTYTGGSGNILVTALPFAAFNGVAGGYNNGSTQISQVTIPSGYSWVSLRTGPALTYLDLQTNGSANSWSAATFSNISSSGTAKELLATVTYFV